MNEARTLAELEDTQDGNPPIPTDYVTVLDKAAALFGRISDVAVAHEGLALLADPRERRQCRAGLVGVIADLSRLGDAECLRMTGRNPQDERVPDWADYTVLPEFEAAHGNIWPLFSQITAVAEAYESLNFCDPGKNEETRAYLADVFVVLARMGIVECRKWERYEANGRRWENE
jgi:hypothetical protein